MALCAPARTCEWGENGSAGGQPENWAKSRTKGGCALDTVGRVRPDKGGGVLPGPPSRVLYRTCGKRKPEVGAVRTAMTPLHRRQLTDRVQAVVIQPAWRVTPQLRTVRRQTGDLAGGGQSTERLTAAAVFPDERHG
jgi:hypothetical protein